METVRLLIIEDNPVDALSLQKALRQAQGANFVVSHAETLSEGKGFLEKEDFHVVVLDLGLPDSRGLRNVPGSSEIGPGTSHRGVIGLGRRILGD